MVSQLNEINRPEREDAFPFVTENPSGVPGITEIEGRVIAAIAGHVAENIEGVAGIGKSGIVRAVTSILASEASEKASGVDVEAGRPRVDPRHQFDGDVRVQHTQHR